MPSDSLIAGRNALQSIFDELEQTGDLDRTVERLNIILESMDSSSESVSPALWQWIRRCF